MGRVHKLGGFCLALVVGCSSAPETDSSGDPIFGNPKDAGGGVNSGGDAGNDNDDSGTGSNGKDAGTTPRIDAGTPSKDSGASELDAGTTVKDAGNTSDDAGNKADAGEPTGCTGKSKPGVSGPLPTFSKTPISSQAGAAYMKPVDLNADGYDEYLLTALSEGLGFAFPPVANGGAYVLRRKGAKPTPTTVTIGTWETTKVFDASAGIGFPNSSELIDIDNDDIKDWVIGAGFLVKPTGKIVWMKGAANGTFATTPKSITVPDAKCWYHVTLPLDIDADGDDDFITTCHVGDTNNVNGPSRVQWFENLGGSGGTFALHAIGDGGGAILELHDLDGDGDQDVVAPQFFGPESMVWFEQTGPKGATWAKHLINNTTGRGFIVKFADVNGDGKTDMVYGNHNNEEAADAKNKTMGIYWFEFPPADMIHGLANWDAYKHTVFEGFKVDGGNNGDSAGSPGMINVGDIDGDCDMDITASGDGDLGLYLFIQQADKFEKVTLDTNANNVNSGEQHIVDLDGDGDNDILWAVFGPQGITMMSSVTAFLQK